MVNLVVELMVYGQFNGLWLMLWSISCFMMNLIVI